MAGAAERYDGVNHYFSEVFELKLKVWGESRHIARRLLRGIPTLESPTVIEFGIGPDGRISQALAVGHTPDDDILRELVRRRLPVDGNQESLKDPAVPLQTLVS